MAAPPSSVHDKLREELNSDDRDVAELWNEALKGYKGIVGFDLKPRFGSVKEMIDFGGNEMNNFHKFRHNEKKVDKLRSLFAKNLDYIEKGAQQLISAATPAFPPAAAIGTALTYMLSACRQVSADYDVVMVFFEDMNSFLDRITILETRLPRYKAYRNCLMDVFTSFLTMCGFATKFIELGRFKKWISNLMKSNDELGGARKTMDLKLARLQNATEFAILGNTVELQKMSVELSDNQKSHTELLEGVKGQMDALLDSSESMRQDMAKLLKAFSQQKKDDGAAAKTKTKLGQSKPPSANRIRNALPEVTGENSEYRILTETMVPDTCTWVFAEKTWESWVGHGDTSRPLLAIAGEAGVGKSHLAATVYEHLRKMAEDDAAHHTCAAQFYFREQQRSLGSFANAVITIVNQVAEQNDALCERLYIEISRDDVSLNWVGLWKDLLHKLLAKVFDEGSKHRLFVVLDGIDELSEAELGHFHEFIADINKAKLKISVVFTSRPDVLRGMPDHENITTIMVTKEKQMSDLKALVWSQLDTRGVLRRFSRYVKQRIADKVEEAAPNLLYAEHMLKRYDAIGREGAVLKDMANPMPPDLHELYESLLAECQRRTPTNRQELVAALLRWTAFSFRPLFLGEVVSLLRWVSDEENLDLVEIPEPLTKFLRIGDPGVDAEARAKAMSGLSTNLKDLEKSADATSGEDKIYNDDILPVKFQERSMRSFFHEAPKAESSLRTSVSRAHREIFLLCAQMARPTSKLKMKIEWRLSAYATFYLIDHWLLINPEEHTAAENAEVMEAFGQIISNQHSFVPMIEWDGAGVAYASKFTDVAFDKATAWSKLLGSTENIESKLSPPVAEWWQAVAQDVRKYLLLELAKGHVMKVYAAANLNAALKSFEKARSALGCSHLGDCFAKQAAKNQGVSVPGDGKATSAKQDALGIAGAFDLEMDATAYRSVAELLFHFRHFEPAQATCLEGLQHNPTAVERFRMLELLARVQLSLEHAEAAKQSIADCLAGRAEDGVTSQLKRSALVTRARIAAELGDKAAAAASYREANEVDPSSLTPGDVLEEEVELHEKDDKYDHAAVIAVVKSWSPLERLTWMTYQYDDWGIERHALYREAAAQTGEKDFMVDTYKDGVKYLDNVSAGAPLRCDLANAYWQVVGDLAAARKVLDEVLDSNSSGNSYAITAQDADTTLERAVNIQTDVLFALFSASREPSVKSELLAAMKGMMKRPLALDVPPLSATFLLHYRVVISRMALKMGPATEFQTGLQDVINTCIDALSDEVGWNDALNLALLAEALAHLSKAIPQGEELWRAARVLFSASFSKLDPGVKEMSDDEEEQEGFEDDDEGEEGEGSDEDEEKPPTNEGDLSRADIVERFCDGVCNPPKDFSRWGGRVAYQCTTCGLGFLCEDCYALRQAENKGEQALKGRDFCGKNHEYIKGPIEGWKGIKDGRMEIEGGENILFKDYLKKIREELCEKAWDEFWEGA